MKKTTIKVCLFIAFFLMSAVQFASAQCTIDTTQTTPGIYPDTIADAIVNHPYSQDITFVLITDTLGFTITNFQIASITGLPFGYSWSCSNSANGCNYDPAVS